MEENDKKTTTITLDRWECHWVLRILEESLYLVNRPNREITARIYEKIAGQFLGVHVEIEIPENPYIVEQRKRRELIDRILGRFLPWKKE